jgi:hypothetical protein
VLLTFKPAPDVIKKLCANSAAAKQGFKVKPVIQRVTEVRRGPNGQVVQEREYGHPITWDLVGKGSGGGKISCHCACLHHVLVRMLGCQVRLPSLASCGSMHEANFLKLLLPQLRVMVC